MSVLNIVMGATHGACYKIPNGAQPLPPAPLSQLIARARLTAAGISRDRERISKEYEKRKREPDVEFSALTAGTRIKRRITDALDVEPAAEKADNAALRTNVYGLTSSLRIVKGQSRILGCHHAKLRAGLDMLAADVGLGGDVHKRMDAVLDKLTDGALDGRVLESFVDGDDEVAGYGHLLAVCRWPSSIWY